MLVSVTAKSPMKVENVKTHVKSNKLQLTINDYNNITFASFFNNVQYFHENKVINNSKEIDEIPQFVHVTTPLN